MGKLARDGLLPPVLAHFIAPLDLYLVLDGHVRVEAARLELGQVPICAFYHLEPAPPSEASFQSAIEPVLAAKTSTPQVKEALIASGNRMLAKIDQAVPWNRVRNRAWRFPGGAAAFETLHAAAEAALPTGSRRR
jgi:hypothetical protein